ncbi:MAG: VWA-like domain-containing protein [Clostridiales bacterium]|jgi:predicted metal-dependent peptidase|nr:VWA-like domain-containing protein [Clostridiales bacterium]
MTKEAEDLADEIVTLALGTLNVRFRYLSLAIHKLRPKPDPETTLSTDGKWLYYGAMHVLRTSKADIHKITTDVLHSLLHCVFRHMLIGIVNEPAWDLACDLVVEAAAAEMMGRKEHTYIGKLRSEVKHFTAEHLCRHFLDQGLKEQELELLRKSFLKDDHEIWHRPALLISIDDGSSTDGFAQSREELSKFWKEIGDGIRTDLETLSKVIGDQTGSLTENLKSVNRERHDYSAFLKKFTVLGEVMKINDDEFDYVYYSYGMKLYGKMPLIEPLEHKEVKLVREFAIAIDTSGSVSGDLVQAFLQKTYNILMTTESFHTKVNICIMQCDAAIQSVAKISNKEDMEKYFDNLVIRGFGGTDFRPVFERVDKMIAEGEFFNLKGLIYFTDGYGVFPSRKPAYETVFVFMDEGVELPDVPPWAIKLAIGDEIRVLEDGK